MSSAGRSPTAIRPEYRVFINAGRAVPRAADPPGNPQISGAGLRWSRRRAMLCAASAHGAPERSTVQLGAPGASQTLRSCKHQSSSPHRHRSWCRNRTNPVTRGPVALGCRDRAGAGSRTGSSMRTTGRLPRQSGFGRPTSRSSERRPSARPLCAGGATNAIEREGPTLFGLSGAPH